MAVAAFNQGIGAAAPERARARSIVAEPDSAARPQSLTFTGSGSEYFRIWVVNLLLTILTLGIYSAWAKVRRVRYFHRNTRLDGAVFDYHADPKAILKGRAVALAILLVYNLAYQNSMLAMAGAAALVAAVMPIMLARAYRFKLRNTSYRGVRFDFHGSTSDAYIYLALFPLVLAVGGFVMWSMWTSFGRRPSTSLVILYTVLPLLALAATVPFAHCLLKRFQHDNAYFGLTPCFFHATPAEFYKLYAGAFGLLLLGGAVTSELAPLLGRIFGALGGTSFGWLFKLGYSAISAYAFYLFARPFLESRLQNLVWNNTDVGSHQFISSASARQLCWIHTSNLLLIVFSLGLYKPFALVRLARYKLASLAVLVEDDLEQMVAGDPADRRGATGQEAGELFNLDIGL